jgi:hypothetical protein
MQDEKDPRAFTIVERYEKESSQKYVLINQSPSLRGQLLWFPTDHRMYVPKDPHDCLHISRYHLENPYWQTFDKYVIPLLDCDMDLRRFHELDTMSQDVRVEQDPELWKKVKQHQPPNSTRAQGNY